MPKTEMGPKDIVLKHKNKDIQPWVVGVPAGVSVADHVKELQRFLGEDWQLDEKTDPADVPPANLTATEPLNGGN